ncbi:hypothetical protein C6P45_003963 [Maudiozyma exigua]|uniref:diphosphoinositol-polyphosphate diphosphatase n=1 Tax=Maudiozyma exigua TaxID=34358 RepID=A0A9P6WBR1_MAUEX|nr:hypothetical protein C6P45_003963 [Kazachstania exigua]
MQNDNIEDSDTIREDSNGSRIDEIIKRESDIIQLIRQGDDLMTLNEGELNNDITPDSKFLNHISPLGSPLRHGGNGTVNDMDLLRDKFDDVIRQFHNEEIKQSGTESKIQEEHMMDADEDLDDKFVLDDHLGKSKKFYEDLGSKNVKEMIPPENFSHVVGEIYRSSFPRIENFDFLVKRLQLKSILVLIPEEYPVENLEFMKQSGIKLFQVGMSGNKEPFVNIPSDLLTKALEIVLDPKNQPILIHCNRGKHRTGCLIGCIRKLQNWSLTMIFDEYRRFAFPKARALDQQFIEMYDDTEITNIAKENSWLPLQW